LLRTKLNRWFQVGFWALLLVFVAAMTALGDRRLPDPPGWQVWHESGSVLDLTSYNGRVITGGYQGLGLYDANGTVTKAPSQDDQGWKVRALEPLAGNRLLIGHTEGLLVMHPGGEVLPVTWPGQQCYQVECLESDPTGKVWVGTMEGVFVATTDPRDESVRLERWELAGDLHSARVFACLADNDGGVWFGTYTAPAGGVSYFSDRGCQHWTTATGLPHANITCLLETSDGSVWAGCGFKTAGGAARFECNGQDWSLVETLGADELAGPKVRSIFEDSRGWVWFGSEQDGLAIRVNDETMVILKEGSGLPHLEVMSFFEAADNALWIGTLSGLVRIEQPAVEMLLEKQDIL